MKVYYKPSQIGLNWAHELTNCFPGVTFESDLLHAYDADVIIATPTFLSKQHLEVFTKLRWIQLVTAGFEAADLDYVFSRHIMVTNAKGVYSIPLAEDIIAKMLAISRHLREDYERMNRHCWQAGPIVRELYGSTVGFLGTGSIASEAALRLRPFGVHLLGYRRTEAKQPEFDEIFVGEAGLEIVLRQSDFVISTLPLNFRTHQLMNYERFQQMKHSAIFINHGRGDVVVQEDLIRALENQIIAGAGLDVTSPEPLPPESKLWTMKNVLITPHTASLSDAIYERLYQLIAGNLSRYIKNEELHHIINP